VQARQRKRMLKDVFALVEKEAFVEAAEMCQLRFKTRGPACDGTQVRFEPRRRPRG